MEKYIRAEMEVVEFETEDVITTSGCVADCAADTCSLVGWAPASDDSCFGF